MTFFFRKASWICFLLVFAGGTACMAYRGRPGLSAGSQKLRQDFDAELRKRKIDKKFQTYQEYVSGKIVVTGLKDKGRLSWIEALIRKPLDASPNAELFTRDLYKAASGPNSLLRVLNPVAAKLDLSVFNPAESQQLENPIEVLSRAIHASQVAIANAFSGLSTAEQIELREKLYSQTTQEGILGYRFGGEDHGARLIELLLRVDRHEILNAGRQLAALIDPAFLRRFNENSIPQKTKTEDGWILVGSTGPDTYDLDALSDVCAIVEPGGQDTYIEGTVTVDRPVLAILDFSGNDVYRGVKPGIQGAAIMGASLILDRSGNDTYSAVDVAQGSALSGIGWLVDEAGDDSYTGDRRVQGQAVLGFGMILDRGGHDRYRAALFGQGVGGTLGFGLLIDQSGSDHYFAGGKYEDSYDDSPGFGAWSQGIGVGARGVANGGIGVLLDGKGNDIYETDYFGHGGGYWFGAGIARDFEGDDQRLGGVRTNFDGSVRTETRYLRWGIGFGCHYAAGFVFDDRGNDTYEGDWASIAYAWDVAIGALFDGEGNDQYLSRGSGVAEAHNAGFAVLCDMRGIDQYVGDGLGHADQEQNKTGRIPLFSFALFQDRAGEDTFSLPLRNRTKVHRGWAGGVFIDR